MPLDPINKLQPFNIDVTTEFVFSNVQVGNLKSDNLLYANGDPYVFTTDAAGANTQVQFNDGNSFAGDANLTFNKTNGTLTVAYIVGDGSNLTGITHYTDSDANAAIDARVTKTFVDNLGIDAATLNGSSDTDFATAAQGLLADSALQSGDNISSLLNDSGYLTSANLSGYATESYVGNAIANLVDSAPGTLDTLNELAAALGDDANFASNVTTLIGTKLATADFTSTADTWLGTKTTDNLTEGSTNLYYTTTRANSAIDARVTKTFVENLAIQTVGTLSSLSVSGLTTATGGVKTANLIDTSGTNTLRLGYGTSGDVGITGNLTVGISGTGNVTATGFIGDGSQLTNLPLTGYATESYVGNAIANLVDSAPGTLDTLNELAAALGDDANFASNVTTLIGTKLATADFDSTANTWIATQSIGSLSDVNLTTPPTDGQALIYDDANSVWIAGNVASGGISFTNSETAPSSPNEGDQWYDPSTGSKYTYLTDTDGSQWVELDAGLPISDSGTVSYNDLTDKPTIPTDVANLADATNLLFSGSYTDLTNQPTLGNIASINLNGDANTVLKGDGTFDTVSSGGGIAAAYVVGFNLVFGG